MKYMLCGIKSTVIVHLWHQLYIHPKINQDVRAKWTTPLVLFTL